MRQTSRWLILAGLVLLAAAPLVAQGQSPGLRLRLEPATTGPTTWLVAEFELPVGLHQTRQEKYFGLTVDASSLPAGATAGAVVYPESATLIGGLPSYEGRVSLRLPLALPPSAAATSFELTGKVFWQLCFDDGICLLPESKAYRLTVSVPAGQPVRAQPLQLQPLRQGSVGRSPGGLGLNLPAVNPPQPPAPLTALPANSPPPSFDLGSLLGLWLLAFVGGLILNLMPCVLPVLSIKVLSLVKQTGHSRRQRWLQAWATVLGIVVSLWLLAGGLIALQAAGGSIGWGIQFQNPWYVIGLLVLVLVFGLSLLDVFQLGTPQLRTKPVSGLAGSFGTGLLTVVLATPCTAPFLGTALGLALASPWWVIITSFTAIGLGLALPFFLLTVWPKALAWLPKPGPWMEVFKGLMAFGLFGTGIWLVTVLQKQLSSDALSGLLWWLGAVGLAAWLAGQIQRSALGRGLRLGAWGLIAVGVLVAGWTWLAPISTAKASPTATAELAAGWIAFSPAEVDRQLQAGHPVLLDFTAEWCLTCKLNEAGPLADPTVRQAFRQHQVALVRGDYTNADPIIAQWLKNYQRAGVPFYAYFQPGQPVQILPELLTKELLLQLVTSP